MQRRNNGPQQWAITSPHIQLQLQVIFPTSAHVAATERAFRTLPPVEGPSQVFPWAKSFAAFSVQGMFKQMCKAKGLELNKNVIGNDGWKMSGTHVMHAQRCLSRCLNVLFSMLCQVQAAAAYANDLNLPSMDREARRNLARSLDFLDIIKVDYTSKAALGRITLEAVWKFVCGNLSCFEL